MPEQPGKRHALLIAASLLALLLATALAYAPGLRGGFLFDDFVNLDAIGATGPVDDWPTFLRYLTSGTADPIGRPLSLLSFLLDARDWPADPASFLRTNLHLHLFNGVLLFLLLRRLGRALDGAGARHVDAAALLGAGLWLLHPLLVSTTLYIVQREAMLPGTFMLLGLLAWLHGRLQAPGWRARAWMLAGIGGGTVLSMLCKGNGVLLPLLAWLLEATVLAKGAQVPALDAHGRRLHWLLLVLPTLALFAWLGLQLPRLFEPIPVRGWTIAQRLLTEGRVLCEYLWLLLVPRSVSTGLYNDAYVASSGWLHPWSTLPAVFAVLGLAGFALWQRARFPALAAALLFFFAGHLLESSVVPLELYFEHRNYVPAMLLFWPLARALFAARWRPSPKVALAVGLLALFGTTTLQRAALWGEPEELAALWAQRNPESSRAQATIAMLDTSAGHPERALQRLGPIWKQRPGDLQVALNFINARCAQGRLPADEFAALQASLRHAQAGNRLVAGWLGRAMETAAAGDCPGLDLAGAGELLAASAANPAFAREGALDIAQLQGQLAVLRAQPAAALASFDRALQLRASPDAAARQAAILATHGYYREALAHLDTYESLRGQLAEPGPGMPRLHAFVLARQGYWENEMRVLRGKLQAEIAAGNEP